MPLTRKNWQRIFETALEDLTGLLAPKKIVYCEGRSEPGINNSEQGLDADVYNEIFSGQHHDVLFVSSGGGQNVIKNASLALKILNKTFVDVELYLLKDKDDNSSEKRQTFLDKDKAHRMLNRREIENYLFDKEILKNFCSSQSIHFDEVRYDNKVSDIINQDLKPIQQEIQACCSNSSKIATFKRDLAKQILPTTQLYQELYELIFGKWQPL